MSDKRKRRRKRKSVRSRLAAGAVVLALSGGILTAPSTGGHVLVTSGGPVGCVLFKVSPSGGRPLGTR